MSKGQLRGHYLNGLNSNEPSISILAQIKTDQTVREIEKGYKNYEKVLLSVVSDEYEDI